VTCLHGIAVNVRRAFADNDNDNDDNCRETSASGKINAKLNYLHELPRHFGIIRVTVLILSAIGTLAPASLNHAVNSPRVELSQIRDRSTAELGLIYILTGSTRFSGILEIGLARDPSRGEVEVGTDPSPYKTVVTPTGRKVEVVPEFSKGAAVAG